MGYHVTAIPKGVIGTVSKIEEEIKELLDALNQGNNLMALQEMSDMYGALELLLRHRFPSVSMYDLQIMHRATRSAFLDGTRGCFHPVVSLAMLRKECIHIHFFGLGFIQIKLKCGDRVHVYHPELSAFVDEPHDHRYDFQSFVLRGSITNTLYECIELEHGEVSNMVMQDTSCAPGFTSQKSTPVIVISKKEFTTIGGESYVMGRDQFHTITTTPICITYLRRSPHAKDLARVVRRNDAPTLCPFSQIIDEETLWRYVNDAFKTLS